MGTKKRNSEILYDYNKFIYSEDIASKERTFSKVEGYRQNLLILSTALSFLFFRFFKIVQMLLKKYDILTYQAMFIILVLALLLFIAYKLSSAITNYNTFMRESGRKHRKLKAFFKESTQLDVLEEQELYDYLNQLLYNNYKESNEEFKQVLEKFYEKYIDLNFVLNLLVIELILILITENLLNIGGL